jgi:hypothetical protein
MPRARLRSHGIIIPAFVVFALALVAVVVNAGSVPHSHASATPGVFNEDHDLSALATVGSSSGLVSQTPSIVPLDAAAPLAAGPLTSAPVDQARRSADSRAPPAR